MFLLSGETGGHANAQEKQRHSRGIDILGELAGGDLLSKFFRLKVKGTGYLSVPRVE